MPCPSPCLGLWTSREAYSIIAFIISRLKPKGKGVQSGAFEAERKPAINPKVFGTALPDQPFSCDNRASQFGGVLWTAEIK